MLGHVDDAIQRCFGLPYLYVTRDYNIHSRCRYLLHKLRQFGRTGLRLLDAGCGSGIALRHLDQHLPATVGQYVGLDLAASRLERRYRDIWRIGTTFVDHDLDDPFSLGSFDVIWCSEVIEHLLDDGGLVGRLATALRPGGMLLLTAPALDFVEHVGPHCPVVLTTSALQDGGHVRCGYRPDDLARLAALWSLELRSVDGVNRLTVAETRARYESRGLRRMAVNLGKTMAERRRADFAIGPAYAGRAIEFHSIAAELRQPLEASGSLAS